MHEKGISELFDKRKRNKKRELKRQARSKKSKTEEGADEPVKIADEKSDTIAVPQSNILDNK